MQWVGYAELASAVSNAGGLGIVCITFIHSSATMLTMCS
jgi:NAD(P)H-dependent flavin oxidoreductase YrpB (nitropropane dioxygenase family)